MNENIVKIVQILTYVILAILFLVNFAILGFHASIIALTSIITENFDLQIFLFLFLTLILLVSFIYVFRAKLSNKFKIPLLLILLILQVIFFKFSFYIPNVDKVVGIQRCVDFGGVWNDATNECIKQR